MFGFFRNASIYKTKLVGVTYEYFEVLATLGHTDEATDALNALHLVLTVTRLLLQVNATLIHSEKTHHITGTGNNFLLLCPFIHLAY
jgi:hypothetical protein